MVNTNRRKIAVISLAGITSLSAAALLMGQGSQPPPRDPAQPPNPTYRPDPRPDAGMGRGEYFVTGDSEHASLWTRDGTSLRWVASADANGSRHEPRTPVEPRNPTYTPPK